MKNILFILFFSISVSFGFAQMNPSQIILKSGDTLSVQGKIKGQYFKYKTQNTAKPIKMYFSEINHVKIRYSKDDVKTYRFFKVKDADKSVVVEDIILGQKASLFANVRTRYVGVAGGGRYLITTVHYYVKKGMEEEITDLGVYDPLLNNLKEKVLIFFSDCDSLVTKIKERHFKIKSDLEKMVQFYNDNCQ